MEGREHPQLVALREARESTIELLSECFARDQLSLEDFEGRIDRAYACSAEAELLALLSDLAPPQPAPIVRAAPAASLPAAPRTAPERLALAVFGNVERAASGALPERARVLSVFGNVELDLRDVQFPPGVTELHVRAVFGNVELTVPPTIAVECRGAPILGSFASIERTPRASTGEATLRVIGSAVLGNVEIKTLPRRALLEASRQLPAPKRIKPK